MKRFIAISILCIGLAALHDSALRAQRGGHGGGGQPAAGHPAGGGHPGGGGHPASGGARHTPSFSGARAAPHGTPARAPNRAPVARAQPSARARFVPSMAHAPGRAPQAGANRAFVNRAPNTQFGRPSMVNAGRINQPNFNRPTNINRRGINGSASANNRPFNTRPGLNRPDTRFSNRQALSNRQGLGNRNFITNNNRNFNSNRNFVNNNIDVRNRLALNQRFTGNNFNAERWRGNNERWRDGEGRWRGGESWGRGGWGRGWGGGGIWNAGGYWNRPWYGDRPWWYWNRPWAWSHSDWYNGYWDWPGIVPNVWLGGAPVGSWLGLLGDTFAYENPYYVAPSSTVDVPEVLNYSTPIPVPTGDEAASAYPTAPTDDAAPEDSGEQVSSETSTQSEDPAVRAANELFDAAREAFKRGDYATAQADVEKAIEQLPSDAVLHEFRALTLFAQGRYSEAAATLYAVLAAGPGWDWATMSSFYPDVSVYTQQLRALEDYVRQHPTAGDARFVLAYHYLVLGYKDEAIKQLTEVVRLTPNDKLSAELLKALTSKNPAPAAAARPAPLTAEPRP